MQRKARVCLSVWAVGCEAFALSPTARPTTLPFYGLHSTCRAASSRREQLGKSRWLGLRGQRLEIHPSVPEEGLSDCPLDPDTATCSPPDTSDRDGDGEPNDTDNCPDEPNPLQTDTDMDGKGDMCDPCPMAANPGAQACPATIYDVKDGTEPWVKDELLRDLERRYGKLKTEIDDFEHVGIKHERQRDGSYYLHRHAYAAALKPIVMDDVTTNGASDCPEHLVSVFVSLVCSTVSILQTVPESRFT